MNFIAHHDATFSHGVGQAGSEYHQVTVRAGQPSRGTGWRTGAPPSPSTGWAPLCRPPPPGGSRPSPCGLPVSLLRRWLLFSDHPLSCEEAEELGMPRVGMELFEP